MALKGGSGENNIGSKVFFLFFGRGGGGSPMKSFKFCKDDICYDTNSLPEC